MKTKWQNPRRKWQVSFEPRDAETFCHFFKSPDQKQTWTEKTKTGKDKIKCHSQYMLGQIPKKTLVTLALHPVLEGATKYIHTKTEFLSYSHQPHLICDHQ